MHKVKDRRWQSIPIINHLVVSIDQADPQNEIPEPSEKTEKKPLINPTPVIERESPLPYMHVSFKEDIVPVLDDEKEEQVQEVLDASKKVLTEEQWKAMEINIADALTSHEKEKVKLQYQKAMERVNWDKMENKLRIAYDNINWNQVNNELGKALVEIKLDSLQKVYTTVITNLSCLEKELVKAGDPGIPDTDITLETVECKKKEVQKAINTIKSARTRKIIDL